MGRVVAETFKARGDELVDYPSQMNYLVFAHRYRNSNARPSYEREMEVNLGYVIRTIDSAVFAAGDQAIVIVSSVSAMDPAMNQTLAYNVSKAALNQVARYYAKAGRRINTVSPDTFTGDSPRVSKQQVANVIAFLCSAAGSGINGQDIRVTR